MRKDKFGLLWGLSLSLRFIIAMVLFWFVMAATDFSHIILGTAISGAILASGMLQLNDAINWYENQYE